VSHKALRIVNGNTLFCIFSSDSAFSLALKLEPGMHHGGFNPYQNHKPLAGLTVAAYSTSRIVTEQTNKHTDRLLFYGEPTPESVGPLREFLARPGAAFQKLILMDTEEGIQRVRPHAVEALSDTATLTTALPGMLEVRPRCCSLTWDGK
jgi:hypothetical protein